MHPMERLRMVARASGEEPGLLAQEAAAALAGCADDPRALVMACRRLVDRQATSGPLWWLAARVVAAADPVIEAWMSAELLREDAGAGRVLPPRLWGAMVDRIAALGDPWDAAWEVVPLELATVVVGPAGPLSPADALATVDCPDAPELTGAGSG